MAKSQDLFAGFDFVDDLPKALKAQQVQGDPVALRRGKMIATIEQQREFWRNPSLADQIQGKRKPRLWIKRLGTDVYITPRYGARPLELREGMPVVKTHMEQVEPFLAALEQAVRDGKLDEQLARLAERTFETLQAGRVK